MEIAKIAAEQRQDRGRKANRRLRDRGMIPAIIYGHNEAPEMISLSAHDLELALEHLAHVIEVQHNGQPAQFLIKDVQYDHLGKDVLHIDLMRVDKDERVDVKVAVVLKGVAPGVQEGGDLVHGLNELDLNCSVLNIPETIEVNVGKLHLNDTITIAQITLPDGVTALHEADEVIASVRPKRTVHEEEAGAPVEGEEGAAEPEVIRRERKAEEESES